ncbi:MAG: hypothetical protein ACP5EP_12475 [Acidobacteriaceae bacterium]
MLAVGPNLKISMLDALLGYFSFRCAAVPGRVYAARPQGDRAECRTGKPAQPNDCRARLLYIEKSLFLTVPLSHMETALHSLAVLHGMFRRTGILLSDASVKANSLECPYKQIQ